MNRISLSKNPLIVSNSSDIWKTAINVANTFMGQNGTTKVLALIVCDGSWLLQGTEKVDVFSGTLCINPNKSLLKI